VIKLYKTSKKPEGIGGKKRKKARRYVKVTGYTIANYLLTFYN